MALEAKWKFEKGRADTESAARARLEREKEAVLAALEDEQAQTDKVMQELFEKNRMLAGKDKDITRLRSHLEEKDGQLRDVRAALREKETENRELADKLRLVQNDRSRDTSPPISRPIADRLRREVAELQEQLTFLSTVVEKQNEQIEQYRLQMHTTSTVRTVTSAPLHDDMSQALSDARVASEAAQEEARQLRQQLQELQDVARKERSHSEVLSPVRAVHTDSASSLVPSAYPVTPYSVSPQVARVEEELQERREEQRRLAEELASVYDRLETAQRQEVHTETLTSDEREELERLRGMEAAWRSRSTDHKDHTERLVPSERAELEELKHAVALLRGDPNGLEALRVANRRLLEERGRDEARLASLEDELLRVKTNPTDMEAVWKAQESVLRAENSRIMSELADAQEAFLAGETRRRGDVEGYMAIVEGKTEQIETLKLEIANLRGALGAGLSAPPPPPPPQIVHTARGEDLISATAQVDSLRLAVATAEQEANTARTEVGVLTRAVQATKDEMEELEREVVRLRAREAMDANRLAKAVEKCERDTARIEKDYHAKLEAEARSKEHALSVKEREIDALKHQLVRAAKETQVKDTGMELQLSEANLQSEALRDAQMELARLRPRLKDAERSIAELEESRDDAAREAKKNRELAEVHMEASALLERARAKARSAVRERDDAVAKSESALASLRDAQRVASSVESMEREAAVMDERIRAAEDSNRELERDKELLALELDRVKGQLQGMRPEVKRARAMHSEDRETVASLQDEKEVLTSDLDLMTSRVAASEVRIEQLVTANEALEGGTKQAGLYARQLQAAKDDAGRFETELKEATIRLDALKPSEMMLDDMKIKVAELEMRCAELEEENTAAEATLTKLREHSGKLAAEMETKALQQRSETQDVESELQAAEKELVDLRIEAQNARRLQDAMDELKVLRVQHNDLMAETEDLLGRIVDAETESKDLRANLSAAESEIRALKSQRLTLASEHELLEEKNQSDSHQLEAAKHIGVELAQSKLQIDRLTAESMLERRDAKALRARVEELEIVEQSSASLESLLKDLRKKLRAVEEAKTEAEEEQQSLRDRLARAEASLTSEKAAREDLEEWLRSERRHLASAEQAVDDAERENQALSEELTSRGLRVVTAEAQLRSIEAMARADAAEAENTATQLIEAQAALERKSAAEVNAIGEVHALQQQLEDGIATREAASAALDESRRDVARLDTLLRAKTAEAENWSQTAQRLRTRTDTDPLVSPTKHDVDKAMLRRERAQAAEDLAAAQRREAVLVRRLAEAEQAVEDVHTLRTTNLRLEEKAKEAQDEASLQRLAAQRSEMEAERAQRDSQHALALRDQAVDATHRANQSADLAESALRGSLSPDRSGALNSSGFDEELLSKLVETQNDLEKARLAAQRLASMNQDVSVERDAALGEASLLKAEKDAMTKLIGDALYTDSVEEESYMY